MQPGEEYAEPWLSALTSSPGEIPVEGDNAGGADDDLFEDAREGDAEGLGHEV